MNTCRFLSMAVTASLLAACANRPPSEPPVVDRGAKTQALKNLTRPHGERVVATVYEFRSSVPELPARGTTDMFKTALVQSGQFRVVERGRLNEGVLREKQLNGAGLTTGKTAAAQLTGAAYIFEGSITEANTGEAQRAGGFSVGGMELGRSTNRDVIGIDVRIIDASTGDVLDVVTVRKSLAGDSTRVSGIGKLIGTVLASGGKNTTYVPDVQMHQQRKESLDLALRAAIDQAVIAIASRLPQQ